MILCVAMMCTSACSILLIESFSFHETYPLLSKSIIWISYVFQNSYAHLLYTQHWSFIGSILNKKQDSKWFASIAGATSIASTIGASGASHLTSFIRLPGLMFMTALALFLSTLLGERAYFLSEKV